MVVSVKVGAVLMLSSAISETVGRRGMGMIVGFIMGKGSSILSNLKIVGMGKVV